MDYGNGEEPKSSAIEEAVRAVLAAISDADGREMVGKRKPKAVSVEVEAKPEECPDCASGMCTEHMSPEDMASLEG